MGTPIRETSTVRTGYHFRGKVESAHNGSRRVVQPKDIRDDLSWSNSTMVMVTPEPAQEKALLAPGDVLVTARGMRPYGAVTPSDIGDALASSAFFILRPTPDAILPEFLAWYLNSPKGQQALTARMRGTAIPALTLGSLSDLEIPLTSLDRQRAIVAAAEVIEEEARLYAKIAEDRRLALSLSI